MKILKLILVLFLLVSLNKSQKETFMIKNNDQQNKKQESMNPPLDFFYKNLHFENKDLVFSGFLVNFSDEMKYPIGITFTLYDEDSLLTKETFSFPYDFVLKPYTIEMVNIRFFAVDLKEISNLHIVYTYHFTEDPILI